MKLEGVVTCRTIIWCALLETLWCVTCNKAHIQLSPAHIKLSQMMIQTNKTIIKNKTTKILKGYTANPFYILLLYFTLNFYLMKFH